VLVWPWLVAPTRRPNERGHPHDAARDLVRTCALSADPSQI